MKTRNFLSIIAMGAAVMISGGCAQELENEMNPALEGSTVVTAGLPSTRTYMSEADGETGARKVYWENGDVININGTASAALAEVGEAASSANFTFPSVLEYPYSAIYPASAYKNASTVTLTDFQGYKNGTFAQNVLPMAAYATSEGVLTFSHLCAVVKLSLSLGEDADEIKHVDFRGNNSEQVCGDFTINYETLALTPASTAEACRSVRANVRKVLSAEAATEVYVVVPAGEYANGFTVKVSDVKGHYMEKGKAAAVTLEAGKVYRMPEFAFAPTGTEVDVEIATAQELVDFAKAYNAGEYDEPLVNLTTDIVFDEATSAAYESIGVDLGNDVTNYFNGCFDGKGFSIKNFTGNKPLFAYTGGAGYIQNLTIDESCSYEITLADPAAVSYLAPLVMRHKGEVVNCHSNASVKVSGTTKIGTNIGGLVCRLVDNAVVDACSVGGNILVDLAGEDDINVGGVICYSSDATTVLKNSSFKGQIDWKGSVSHADNNKDLALGGVASKLNNEVENCKTEKTAVINLNSAVTRTSNVGGIVGESTATAKINGCTNESTINIALERNGDKCRYVYTGGISGKNSGEITESVNNGAIATTSDVKMQYLGGIAGILNNGTKVSKNVNGEDHSFFVDGGVRQLALGGLYGSVAYDAVLDFTAESDYKLANIEIAKFEMSKYSYLYVGGLVGLVSQTNSLELKAPKVNCDINVTAGAKTAVTLMSAGIGAVVGVAGVIEASFSKDSDGKDTNIVLTDGYAGGLLTVSDAHSKGRIILTNAKTALASSYSTLGIGGTVGFVSIGGAELSNCRNETSFTIETTKKSNGKGIYMGGIAGYIAGGVSSVTGCTNAAAIANNHYNNNAWGGEADRTNGSGGVLGAYGYKTSGEADRITISNCANTAKLNIYRGMTGGIAAYLRNGTVSNCNNTGEILGNHSFVGGIIGVVENTTVENCTAKSNVTSQTSGSAKNSSGGIAGVLTTSSKLSGCAYSGTVTCKTDSATDYIGGLAGSADATCAVESCKFGGSLIKNSATTTINADNVDTYAVGNGLTVTGCQYWNGAE